MQCKVFGYLQVDMISVWTIKYTLRVSLKISRLQSIYIVVISAKYSFISLIKNNYAESDIQKGLGDNVTGTIEHNEVLTYMIKHARKSQRDLLITLIDLRNAFGQVHHSLLSKVLEYHHVPSEVKVTP